MEGGLCDDRAARAPHAGNGGENGWASDQATLHPLQAGHESMAPIAPDRFDGIRSCFSRNGTARSTTRPMWTLARQGHDIVTRDLLTLEAIKAELKALLPDLKQRYPISYLGIFGSWVRDERRPDSDIDIDILVEFHGAVDLFDLAELKADLEDHLGRRVDLAQRNLLKPRLAPTILAEAQAV
jgi:predicted nucleotidyltransferase